MLKQVSRVFLASSNSASDVTLRYYVTTPPAPGVSYPGPVVSPGTPFLEIIFSANASRGSGSYKHKTLVCGHCQGGAGVIWHVNSLLQWAQTNNVSRRGWEGKTVSFTVMEKGRRDGQVLAAVLCGDLAPHTDHVPWDRDTVRDWSAHLVTAHCRNAVITFAEEDHRAPAPPSNRDAVPYLPLFSIRRKVRMRTRWVKRRQQCLRKEVRERSTHLLIHYLPFIQFEI